MSEMLPVIYLARHGETAWSLSGQHTGRTDLPLTELGERNARALGERLRGLTFAKVVTSPLQRAVRTCDMAGFGTSAEIDPDLVEWDYGQYESRRTADIHAERPDWQLFRDGCPGGESPDQIGARADRVVGRDQRRRAGFFERAFPPSIRRPLARSRRIGWPVSPAEHCEPQRARL
jgi:broad specificity phosphatase PhoE